MKRCIFTVSIGDVPAGHGYQYSLLTMAAYARKVGADFVCKTSLEHSLVEHDPPYPPHLEKLEILSLLKKYDCVLYLDADILITPWASDIFKELNDPTKFYIYNEGWHDRDGTVQDIFNRMGKVEWAKTGDYLDYYNTGVMLFYKSHAKILEAFDYKECFIDDFHEQTYLNYLIAKTKADVCHLPDKYNRMAICNFKLKERSWQRFRASFIHYAGWCFVVDKDRTELMREDYLNMYERPRLKRKRNIGELGSIFNSRLRNLFHA